MASVNCFRSPYCPNNCICDNLKLHVTCGDGALSVVPIILNPAIQRLVIKFNKIKTIDSFPDFYKELTMLDLSYNNLLHVPAKTFTHQKKLLQLHLNNNKIGEITNNTYYGLENLEVLNLRNNLITELTKNVFKVLPNLEELNLGENRISSIDVDAFQGLTKLKILYLDDNTLNTIPSTSFKPLRVLAELFIGINSFVTIQNGAFNDLQQLTRLDLHGAMLINLTLETFSGLERMKILDLSDNHLVKIPTIQLSNLKRLEELIIGQNDFDIVPEGAFYGLNNLKRIDISGAINLGRIQSGAFASNTNLETIVIASNKHLVEIQDGAFSGLPFIKNVNLRDNNLMTVREELLPWKSLKQFDLSDNPLDCNCQLLWLKDLLPSSVNGAESDERNTVICITPDRFHGEPLEIISADLLGCHHIHTRERAIFGFFIVGAVAVITTIFLILYRYRHRIIDYVRNTWTNKTNSIREKEHEYQKTFAEEDYHQSNCNIYSYPYQPTTFTTKYSQFNSSCASSASIPTHQPYIHNHYVSRPQLPISEL